MKSHPPAIRRSQSGFALLITVTLLAFLVLLLVSLATLTRVETQVSINSQQLSQARQNALMALNVALGRLQAAAGPDTRTTGTADLVAGRNINKKNWTGVWNAAAGGADKNIAWLVSGTAPAGAAGVTGALSASSGNSLVELVGTHSADISATATTGNQVRVETQPITSTVPGVAGTPTIGNFAYWVGDEGVKAGVLPTDPWESPAAATLSSTSPATTAAQAQAYRFVNAQRFGIEGVGKDAADTKLGAAYPATDGVFKEALSKVVSLSQLPFANADATGQAALASALRPRFHDLTARSRSLLTDVVKGGFKRDLTAWIADSTSNPAGSGAASAAYITPGNSGFTYGLPKWALIRDYATNTLATGAAVAPRFQTDSQQGIYPVITYARMAFGLSCANATPSAPPANGGPYKYHMMPAVALWNPYNVPIQASTNDSNSYELCFRYTHNKSDTQDVFLKVITFGPERDLEGFNLSRIRMEDSTGVAGYPGGKMTYGVGTEQQFWRFRVKLTRDLAPGESRLFTIDDSSDGTQYSSGQSLLSDAVVDLRNSVYIPSGTGTGNSGANAVEIPATATSVFVNTEPAIPPGGVSYFARMQVRLTKPVPAGTAAASINDFLTVNSYQAIVGNGFNWGIDTNPPIAVATEANRDENPFCAEQIELAMSSLNTTDTDNSYSGPPYVGQPRWLAVLNPQASLVLRKPYNEVTGAAYAGPFYNATPSYLRRQYIKASAFGYVPYTDTRWRVPLSDGASGVSAGLQVSVSATGGTAQKLVIRELQPANVPLFSIAQLQQVNVSSLSLNPAYAIGNSLANLYVDRADSTAHSAVVDQDSFPEATTGFPASATTGGKFAVIYDLSYLLNKALWDGYFFSTVPSSLTAAQASGSDYHLPNARNLFYWNTAAGAGNATELGELKATATAAAHLVVNGGFNVNSTSMQAWRALLYGHIGVDAADPTDTPYSRFTAPVAGAQPNATWLGYRSLTADQIDALATAIVAEVRSRGPFLSLADFVNRRLKADATGLKGPLQAAIDATTGAGSINGVAPFTDSSLRISAYPRDIANPVDAEQQIVYVGGSDNTQPSASRAAFAPGYLTQADLLTALGPSLTARSDTFRIRAYGDTVNPATGAIQGSAWCEAIVQRIPDYVDATNASTVAPASASTLNKTFGRRFKVVSFRWLTSNDI